MKFSAIPGLPELKHQLIQSVNKSQIPHAQLFYGLKGSIQLPLARAYVQYIACEARLEDDSCGNCRSCKQLSHHNHPNLHYVFPTATTKKYSKTSDLISDNFLGEWRSLLDQSPFFSLNDWLAHIGAENKQAQIRKEDGQKLESKLRLKSTGGGFKFAIIWLPEQLNATTANKLLKTIEEPQGQTLLLLVSENADALLGTITSRCQKTFIPSPSTQSIQKHLQSKGLGAEEAQQAASLADGDIIEAERIADESGRYLQYAELFKNWMRACYAADTAKMLQSVEEFSKLDRDPQKEALSFFQKTLQIIITKRLHNDPLSHPLYEKVGFQLQRFGPFIHPKNISPINTLLEEAIFDIRRNGNPRILMADVSIRMARLLKQKTSA